MKRAKIGELKDHLSRYLEHVRGGGTVVVLDRDRPVAHIVPVQRTTGRAGKDGDRLARLEHRGLIRRGRGGLPRWLGRRRPAKLRSSLLADLLAEREAGW